MKLSDAALHRVTDNMAFRASAAAYLVLDRDLHIRAANRSYEEATLHRSADMIGEFMFDVFPDNPDAPQVNSVGNLEYSLESVLRHGCQSRMGLQRYDVRDPSTGMFVNKTWLPVNSPILDADGNTVAILHHVEDVSHMIQATSLERLVSTPGWANREAGDVAHVRDVQRVRQDAQLRSQRAGALSNRSAEAIERAVRRISAYESGQLLR
jgi:PAS domain-containing protein